MSRQIAGKALGLGLGLIYGWLPGALIGLLIGHWFDKRQTAVMAARARSEGLLNPAMEDGLQQSTFTIGVIVLGAKMAKADGRVSHEEIAAFRRVFRVPDDQVAQVGNLFDQARLSADGYEPYAARLAQVFRAKPAVLEEILTGLFLVAVADSVGLSRAESIFLRRVATLFGFSVEEYARIAASSGVRLPDQPAAPRNEAYAVLGLPETASAAEIKRTYRVLIRKHHPDKLVAEGLPPEMIAQANEKMKRINAAYDSLCKAKGIK